MRQFITLFNKEWREWRATVIITLSLIAVFIIINDFSFWNDIQHNEEVLKNPLKYQAFSTKETVALSARFLWLFPKFNSEPRTYETYNLILKNDAKTMLNRYITSQNRTLFFGIQGFIIQLIIMFILASSLYRERRNQTVFYLKSFPFDDRKMLATKFSFILIVQLGLLFAAGFIYFLSAKISLAFSNTDLTQVLKSQLTTLHYLNSWGKYMVVAVQTVLLPVPIIAIFVLFLSILIKKVHPFIIALLVYFALDKFLPGWIPSFTNNFYRSVIENLEATIRPLSILPATYFIRQNYTLLGQISMSSTLIFWCYMIDFVIFGLLSWGLLWLYQRRMNTA